MTIWQDASGNLHDDMNGAALLLPSWPQGMTLLTDTQVAALAVPTAAQQWVAFQGQAQAALSGTSVTLERICEGVALGTCAFTNPDVVAFMSYRKALRAILSEAQPAAIPTALPIKPAYPAGT